VRGPSQRNALGVLFAAIAVALLGIAYTAGGAGVWPIAFAAAVLGAWMGTMAWRGLRRR
jgi:heme O synthase-like polyprenyltransferase